MWWLVIAIPGAIVAALGLLLWRGAREHRGTAKELAALRGMSAGDAEQYALELLAKPDLFETRQAQTTVSNPNLPSQVQALLNRYEKVVCGEFWVGVEALSQHPRFPGYIKIGGDSEFTELLVKPGEQSIYVSYGEGPESLKTLEVEPSIWHAIIIGSGVAPKSA